ncbi:hypothetical protein [Bacillus sp. mrc49]|uniref:hypothetical protein n=1 Tax=Bacillus sp. mrc49 TaxID=2054913 RepID=UPI0012FDB378|nr:hypothetical protein [Bacillus sp. mrc49]
MEGSGHKAVKDKLNCLKKRKVVKDLANEFLQQAMNQDRIDIRTLNIEYREATNMAFNDFT